jgi:hypothetical protein
MCRLGRCALGRKENTEETKKRVKGKKQGETKMGKNIKDFRRER